MGYRLFCGVAGSSDARRSAVITNLVSGALLALLGTGILVADLRGFGASMASERPSWQKKSAQHGLRTNRYDRFV